MPEAAFHLYIAVSIDGLIADAEGSVDWLNAYETGVDYGTEAFAAGMDALIMGRRTFDQICGFGEWPYAGKRVLVLTSRPIADPPPDVEATSDLAGAIVELREEGAQVWILGGASTAAACRDLGALDHLHLFIMPILLGDGVPLFAGEADPLDMTLETATTFDTGVVALRYSVL